jgi:hypothetical protein
MFQAMLPRWGGSHRAIIQFGLECADTKRYDTDVPFQLVNAMNWVRDDGVGWNIFRSPELFDQVAAVLRGAGEFQPPQGKSLKAWDLSVLTGYAWQAGRMDVARQTLDEQEGKYDEDGFERAEVPTTARMISGIFALTGDHADALQSAEQLAATGQFDQAADAYAKIAATVAAGDRTHHWIAGRTRELQMLAKFYRGEQVDLIPEDDQLTGLQPFGGKWSVSKGDARALIGVADRNGLGILCGARFGPRYEIRATMQIIDDAGSSDPAMGVLYGYITDARCNALWLFPKSQTKRVYYDPNAPMTDPMKGAVVGGENHVLLRVWDDHASVIINDKEPIDYGNIRQWAQAPEALVGVGSTMRKDGTKVKFTDVSIHRLTEDFKK